MVTLLTVLGVVVVISLLLIVVYKLLLCPQNPSYVYCDWQDARAVLVWNSESEDDEYQISYKEKNNQSSEWCILPDLRTNRHSLSIINGISYEIKIRAKNSFGTSLLASVVSGRSRASAPEHLNVSYSTNMDNSISLCWTMVENCNGYVIKRTASLEDGAFTYVKRIDDPKVTNFQDTSFIFGTKYYYKIVSLDRAGESGGSNSVLAFPRAPPPSDLTVSYDECMGNSIKLQWEPVLSCHGYEIRREVETSSSRGQICMEHIPDPTVKNTEDHSFIFGLTYSYMIVSFDKAGESGQSNVVSICPRAPAPNNLVASYDENTGSVVSLCWNPVPYCDRYIVKKLKSSVRGMCITQTFVVSSEIRLNDALVTFGNSYYYYVVSVDRAGESKRSNQVKICPRAPPPKDLTVSYDQDNCTSIIIQWKPVVNCEGYIVQRTTNRANGEVINIKSLNSPLITKIADTSFTFGVEYTYTVVSLDQMGESSRSKPATVCPRVPAVKDLTISFDEKTNSSIYLSWKPVKKCRSYIVQRADNTIKGPYSTIATVHSTSETEIIDPTFTFGIKYHYIVVSVDQAGTSDPSKAVSVFPRAPPPNNVVVSFEEHDDYFILLRWEPLNSAQGYIIKRTSDSLNNSAITTKRIYDPWRTSIEYRGFTYGVTYRYTVTSVDQAGESDRSTEVSFCPRIQPPEDLTIIPSKDVSGTILIEWASVPDSNGYCLYRAPTNNFIKETLVATISESNTYSYTDLNLQNGIDYWYKIASIDSAGVSSCSEAVCGKAILLPPTNLSATALHEQNAILLEWTGVPSAAGYRIERKNNVSCFATVGYVHDAAITKFIDMKNVLTDIKYSYTIYAFDETSESLQTCSTVTAMVLSVKQQHTMAYTLDVKLGDLSTEKVDGVVICSTSDELMRTILHKSGIDEDDLDKSDCVVKPAGQLPCKKIIFNPWRPSQTSEHKMRESLRQFVSITMEQAAKVGCNTLAYPAIGCGRFNCDAKIVADAMISEAYHQFQLGISNIKHVSFIIEQQKQKVYETFHYYHKLKEYFSDSQLRNNGLPVHWQPGSNSCSRRINLPESSAEYKMISDDFISSMSALNPIHVVRVQRIQNERLYQQHLIERKHLEGILKQDTQLILYHGCANDNKILQSIIEHGFDRNRAGKAHGTWYGHGVYFSSKATESHRYVKPHRRTKQCVMFLCSVLIGKSTLGNTEMDVCPEGYQSTTDNSSSIYVVYRDAQAYTNYLIYYK